MVRRAGAVLVLATTVSMLFGDDAFARRPRGYSATLQDVVFTDNEAPGDLSDTFTGQVTSAATACIGDRIVKLFRVKPNGDRVLMGQATTDSAGYFTIFLEDPPDATYVVKLTEKDLGRREYCKGARKQLDVVNTTI